MVLSVDENRGSKHDRTQPDLHDEAGPGTLDDDRTTIGRNGTTDAVCRLTNVLDGSVDRAMYARATGTRKYVRFLNRSSVDIPAGIGRCKPTPTIHATATSVR